MKTLPISGTMKSVSFYEDDTIDVIRQLVALELGTHPDRLFMEVKTTLPKEYYATNPKHWTDLFLRLSYDGNVILPDTLRAYLTQIRLNTGMTEQEISKEEWEEHSESVQPLYNPDMDFDEWRIFGVPEVNSVIMPLPPKDLPLPSTRIPNAQIQSLYETLHKFDVSEIRATTIPDPMSELVKRNYFPRLRPDTPVNIESMRNQIEASRQQFAKLLALDTPKHEKTSIAKAKWYVPFLSTKFTAPRNRFEQIFYGLTLSKDTPYVGFFTAKTETMRHKFFVEDPKNKKPVMDTSMFKGWFANTQPQRRKPTLLFYRGTSRFSFDRIAITDKDITFDVRREKTSTETLEEMRVSIEAWLRTLDAVVPFLSLSDLEISRWELGELSVVANYSKDITEFDMHRFPCLQTMFSFQNDTFRLLRAEHSTEDISPREIQALQLLTQEDAERSPSFLAQEMNISPEEANELFTLVQERSEEFDLEKSLKAYPVVKFSNKEVIIKFVTSLERTLEYVDILRFVLTSESDAVNDVCPRRMEKVVAKVVVPQQVLDLGDEFSPDEELNALLGLTNEEVAPVEEESVAKPSKKVKVSTKGKNTTYNYFNNRLQEYDPDTFDKLSYPKKCNKSNQVIVLTEEDRARMGESYNYEDAPESEKLPLENPDGLAICPPYWCMRDEIPLRENQLIAGEDNVLHCPVCNGKVQQGEIVDTTEFTVIKRDMVTKYPDLMKFESSINKRKFPCCYQNARSDTAVMVPKTEIWYIMESSSANVPERRLAFLTPELSARLSVKTKYETSVKKGRLQSGEADVFRIGLGRPSKSLPILLGDKTAIRRPKDAKENLIKCSFFRTWRKGGSNEEDMITSIDKAYEEGQLSVLEELEYVTSFLKCEVILVDRESMEVNCGFWSDTLGASSRTIVVFGNTILGYVNRKTEKKDSKVNYTCDIRKTPFITETLPLLRELHTQACAVNVPVLSDAIKEIQGKGKTDYEVILDPLGRIQAVFIPNELLLPVHPSNAKADMGVPVRDGFHSIRDDELPDGVNVRAFLKTTIHPGFKKMTDIQDMNGMITEFMLASGYRIPVVPEEPDEGPDFAGEVLQTIRGADENTLVRGVANPQDIRTAQNTSYAEEMYEFLLFSLSQDIQDEYTDLRTAIVNRSPELYKELQKWFKEEVHEDTTKSPVEFVNKVRTPCGQLLKDTCSKSSLCGWYKNTCKIRVKPIVDKTSILTRIAKTLRDNDKQRSLVLDARMSPFFSTILYLEMPHELITSSIP